MAGKKMKGKIRNIWFQAKVFIPWFVVGIAGISVTWFADAVHTSIKELWNNDNINGSWLFITFIFFFVMIVLLAKIKNNLFAPRTKELIKQPVEKRKHLILFLSPVSKFFLKKGGIPDWFNPSWKLKKDLDDLKKIKQNDQSKRWSWEMPLRGIEGHLDVLQSVTIICSKDTVRCASAFLKLCKGYDELRNRIFYLLAEKEKKTQLINSADFSDFDQLQGYDFENFDEMIKALLQLQKEFKKLNCLEKDTVIDITGGQKPNSVVGAVVTFTNKLKFQYVRTNEPYDIVSYDVIQSTADTESLKI